MGTWGGGVRGGEGRSRGPRSTFPTELLLLNYLSEFLARPPLLNFWPA